MKLRIILIVTVTLILIACSNWDDLKVERAKRAARASGDIIIGAVWPWDGARRMLWEGIELAVEEINAKGGVLNRKLRIVKENDDSSLAKGRLVAQQFAENLDMIAVIGHLDSYIALPASSIYQSNGLVYLTPGAHSYQINNQGYDLIFRSTPSNRSVGIQMANYMASRDYRRVAIYYFKDKSSQDMSNYFEQQARDLGITIVDRRSYTQGTKDFSSILQNWKDLYQFDALFLAANMPSGAYFITQARKIGLNIPIVTGDGLDTNRLIDIAANAAEGVVVPEFFVSDDNWPTYHHFKEIFMRKYNYQPNTNAAQGYDAVHLIIHAIQQAKSTIPENIAKALHATRKWLGATGEFTFDDKGDISTKKVGIKIVRGGKFETMQ